MQAGDQHDGDHRRADQRREQADDHQEPRAKLGDHAHPRLEGPVREVEAAEPARGARDLPAASPVVVAMGHHRDAHDDTDKQGGFPISASLIGLVVLSDP
jgi:hypothetical protein